MSDRGGKKGRGRGRGRGRGGGRGETREPSASSRPGRQHQQQQHHHQQQQNNGRPPSGPAASVSTKDSSATGPNKVDNPTAAQFSSPNAELPGATCVPNPPPEATLPPPGLLTPPPSSPNPPGSSLAPHAQNSDRQLQSSSRFLTPLTPSPSTASPSTVSLVSSSSDSPPQKSATVQPVPPPSAEQEMYHAKPKSVSAQPKFVSARPVSTPAGSAKPKSLAGPMNWHQKVQPPNRPGFGTKGRKMMVRANFFPIRLPDCITVYHYDVVVSGPKKLSKELSRKVYEEFQRVHLGRVIGGYDGSKSSYYSKRLFPRGQTKTYKVQWKQDDEKVQEYTVELKEATFFDIDARRLHQMMRDTSEIMPTISAFDVVLSHLPALRMAPVGRSFFTEPDRPFALGGGKEVWSGYYQSVRPTMGWKLMLNVDTAATAFYSEQNVFDFLCMTLRRCHPKDAANPLTDADRQQFASKELNDFERRQFCKEIKGLRIVVTHLPYKRKYKVVDVTRCSARTQMFPLSDGKKISVENYFRETYPNSRIAHPKLPCLHVGSKERKVYLPIDVCEIVKGQRSVKKLTEGQLSNMIRHTAKPAYQREKEINQTVRNARYHEDSVVKGFGIRVDTKMVEIPSHVLDPPKLKYSGTASVVPESGKGAWEMRGKKFYHGITVHNWAVVVCDYRCGIEDTRKFVTGLVQQSGVMGMQMAPRPTITQLGKQSVDQVFRQLLAGAQKPELIVGIIAKSDNNYNQIKRLGDTVAGMNIATQCVLSLTVQRKCNTATLANICLKINARLGGYNTIIDPTTRPSLLRGMPVIIFGADVTHPRSDDTTSPSIASVVASVDLDGSRYRALHRVQKHRQEIIADLREMAKEHFKEFYRCTKQKPVKVIFYRDGVSEGQFDSVRMEEIAALQGACMDLQEGYQPKITFVVVQKRHHTRFFPVSQQDAGNKGNVPPGTTVDMEITHPTQHDFYLCSHAAIQGTSRPCHYHILWDDSDFSADDIHLFTYQLCHMFWRCNRAVSYPAPTYYAHRDAAHARMLLQAAQDNNGSSFGGDSTMPRAEQALAIQIHKDRLCQMYFM